MSEFTLEEQQTIAVLCHYYLELNGDIDDFRNSVYSILDKLTA